MIIGGNKPPERPNAQVDVTKLPDIRCENPSCGNVTFEEVVLLKRVPAFMTDNNKDGVVPIPVFACNACGFVNEMFLPPFMRKSAPVETRSTVTEAPAEQSKPTIEIVK